MKNLSDYSRDEVEKFDKMHVFLKEYNRRVENQEMDPLEKPPFTDHEMYMYSRYRELVIAKECEELTED